MLIHPVSNDEAQLVLASMICNRTVDIGATSIHQGVHPSIGTVVVVIDAMGDAAVMAETYQKS